MPEHSPEQSSKQRTARIEVFRPGTFTTMGGVKVTFSDEDISAIASSYDAQSAPAPVVVGHPSADAPAYGWADRFFVENGILLADISAVPPEFASAVKSRRYQKISMAFFSPDDSANPKPGQYYPRHIGFLGGAAPAVPGLTPVNFADASIVEVAFALPEASPDQSDLFAKFRNLFSEFLAREATSQDMPNWQIAWSREAGQHQGETATAPRTAPETAPETAPSSEFGAASPIEPSKLKNEEEMPMPSESENASEERLAALERREAQLASRENMAFATELSAENKIRPKDVAVVAALLGEFSEKPQKIEFATNDQTVSGDAAALFREFLENLSPIVVSGATDLSDAPEAPRTPIAFSVPGDVSVDPEDLKLLAAAKEYAAEHNVDVVTAAMKLEELT